MLHSLVLKRSRAPSRALKPSIRSQRSDKELPGHAVSHSPPAVFCRQSRQMHVLAYRCCPLRLASSILACLALHVVFNFQNLCIVAPRVYREIDPTSAACPHKHPLHLRLRTVPGKQRCPNMSEQLRRYAQNFPKGCCNLQCSDICRGIAGNGAY